MARSNTPSDDKAFRRKEPDSRLLTSERIADDIQAFRQAGGHIEVLGVTRVLTKLEDTVADATAPARPAAGTRRGATR
ncbi:hypothetical protein [Lysobacter fragariae]